MRQKEKETFRIEVFATIVSSYTLAHVVFEFRFKIANARYDYECLSVAVRMCRF